MKRQMKRGENMESELVERYELLLKENSELKEVLESYKNRLAIYENFEKKRSEAKIQTLFPKSQEKQVTNSSPPHEKIALFISLFCTRKDVFAKRWENKQKKSGYTPVCENEWIQGKCIKPQKGCSKCKNQNYMPLSEKIIENHLRGMMTVGVYPLFKDETTHFLVMDFDEKNWDKDIEALREIFCELKIDMHVERSRSGKGAHVWIFFTHKISASKARKLGSCLLTLAMNRRSDISFSSYDRFFPSQDSMPSGGLGNLIALPFQKEARKSGNSEFIDENFLSYADQWQYLSQIQKLDEAIVDEIIFKWSFKGELGELFSENEEKGWIRKKEFSKTDFRQIVEIEKSDRIKISKRGITAKGLNQLKRLAVFRNPEFYKAQAMRLPTYDKPRIIQCFDEDGESLFLPRGCFEEMGLYFQKSNIEYEVSDTRNFGKKIEVEFLGNLYTEQKSALNALKDRECGVLSGTTAFGKSVVALALIAELKINTLIIVDKISLVEQWKKRISEFLNIKIEIVEVEQKNKRRKKVEVIGQLGGGKESLKGSVDIAVMQSLYKKGEIHEAVTHYGMVIVDECHHVSAVSFEQVLKKCSAKYVYGLSATPFRKDGHHPIIHMQCGEIRYKDDAKVQADKRPFEHYIVPRFTQFKSGLAINPTIQELYSELIDNEYRNHMILEDILCSYEKGRNCLLLSERTVHIDWFEKQLKNRVEKCFSVNGKLSKKENRESLEKISLLDKSKNFILLATGKYIGEGFDEPRLDTLFLAMPVSWKGTIQQYAGRLHRLYQGKEDVQIYDYIDIEVKMLEKMYHKRLEGYASIGYKIKSHATSSSLLEIIYSFENYLESLQRDIRSAVKEVVISSSYMSGKKLMEFMELFKSVILKGVKVRLISKVEKYKLDFQTAGSLKNLGIVIERKENYNHDFAVIDREVVWYGGVNILGDSQREENLIRIIDKDVASALIKLCEKV